jgi:hypothetical protein
MINDRADAADSAQSQPLHVEKIIVQRDRVFCFVCIPDPQRRMTDANIAQKVRAWRPHIDDHACVNPCGSSFGAVIEKTSIPHLLEHMVIDLMIERSSDPNALFTGVTTWADRDRGIARIEVSFTDDLDVLRAFCDATSFLNVAMLECQHVISTPNI